MSSLSSTYFVIAIFGSHYFDQAMGVLKSIQPGEYHVTVVAPDTFNHFTPLLPSAAVGTVNVRSLVESIRKVC